MKDTISINENIEKLRLRMDKAAQRAGRPVTDIELMAVTKFQPLEAVQASYQAGIRLFGENRVQEAADKYEKGFHSEFPGSCLDMVGQLQRNKIKKALNLFDSIQSVGTRELLDAILERSKLKSEERERILGLYFELHTGEETKSGFAGLDELSWAVDACLEVNPSLYRLKLKGLMTMAPFTSDMSVQRKAFRALSNALAELQKRFALFGFDELSMGMSSDFETAIEEGSTLVRIGTAIFGERT